MGHFACSIASYLLSQAQEAVEPPLNGMIRRWWAVHSFHAHSRLDVPTFEQRHVRRELERTLDGFAGRAAIWEVLTLINRIISTLTQLLAQVVVLYHVLRFQRDGMLLGVMTLFAESIYWLSGGSSRRSVRGKYPVIK